MKTVDSFNIQIWVGLRIGYTSEIYTIDDVRRICDEFCNEVKQCVTITPTEYRYVDGSEDGVMIGFINYPRFPATPMAITDRALVLAHKLMIGLKQNRVSVVTPQTTYMLTND